MFDPGTVFASTDDRTEILVLGVNWQHGENNMARLPRVIYAECNNGQYSIAEARYDLFKMEVAYSTVTRQGKEEPKC